jgi:serine/threonine protein kinase
VLIGYEGEVKLIDFGIAKAAGKASKTQAGILKGKFGYMSPEQVRGLPIDRRSDIFALGIVLYEMLTGERLFIGESDFSTLEKVRNVEIIPPSSFNSDNSRKARAHRAQGTWKRTSRIATRMPSICTTTCSCSCIRLGNSRHARICRPG